MGTLGRILSLCLTVSMLSPVYSSFSVRFQVLVRKVTDSVFEFTDSLYSQDDEGNRVYHETADFIQDQYSPDECRAEAERLLSMPFTISEIAVPQSGLNETVVTLTTSALPFPVHVTTGWKVSYEGRYTVLYAHAHCDYYEQMMAYKQFEANTLATQYGLQIERDGQNERVAITSYDQLENVIDYLNAANNLYDFRMDESFMANSLSDIRTRPALIPYIQSEMAQYDILKLYYVINHDRYPYVKNALLPALQAKYIAALDEHAMLDPFITDKVREERVKPALAQLLLNGVPLEKKQMNGFVLDPNIVFTYNWLSKSYTGDIRLCFPAKSYDNPPDVIGDDRNFRYLVELLGGSYESMQDTSLLPNYYTATWNLGGNEYGAGSILQSYIPTMSAFSKNGVGISLDFTYSKDMWGLEDGYSTDDFFLRITPEGLGTLLGVTVEADYSAGTLNLITPEGYFDQKPSAVESVSWPARFRVEKILSENNLAVKNNRYIIISSDGSIIEDATTADYTYAECTQVTENVVMVHISGAGSVNQTVFYDTEQKESGHVFNDAFLLKYPYVAYSPQYSGKVIVADVETGAEAVLIDDGYQEICCLRSARHLEAGDLVQISYTRPDALGWIETSEEVLPAIWP